LLLLLYTESIFVFHAETTVSVDTSTSEILKKEVNAENEQIRKELEDLKKTVTENMEETKFKFVAMDERLFGRNFKYLEQKYFELQSHL
jgi:hypothetical protein